MSYMIKLTPAFKDYLWGGTRLRDDFGKDCTLAVVAESWELSTHPDGLCRITGGAADGQTLAAWLLDHPAALGTRAGERTEVPVLIKFIDAAQNLSVQVHPDDDYARRVENDMGKTELWYVLDAAEGAEVIYGVSVPLSRQELADRAADGSITEVLCHVPVQRGDALLVRAGTLHGIGAGTLICEIQQASNVTYRVYDYGRVAADGKPRALHIEKAQDVARLLPQEEGHSLDARLGFLRGGQGRLLAATEYFTVCQFTVKETLRLAADTASFYAIVVTDGMCTLTHGMQRLVLVRGETAFIPAGLGAYDVTGSCEILLTYI